MKKIVCRIMAIILFCAQIQSLNFVINAESYKEEEKNTNCEVVAYSIGSSAFVEFIKEPKLSTITEGYKKQYTYKKSEKTGFIDFSFSKNGELQQGTAESGIMRIGYLPVYTEFVEFAGSKIAIQKCLEDNGIKGEIISCVVIEYRNSYPFNIPITIWIQTTNDENYFITVQECLEDLGYYGSQLAYRLYTYSEFSEKYSRKDGVLLIDEKDITAENNLNVQFEGDGVILPFDIVMENLGAEVNYDSNNKEINIKFKDNEYIFKLDEYPHLLIVGDNENKELDIMGWDFSYEIIDEKVFVPNNVMQELINYLMKASITVNYNDLTVTIRTDEQGKKESIGKKTTSKTPLSAANSTSEIIVTIGKNVIIKNGEEIQIDPQNSEVVPYISDEGRTMVPLRVVSESLGAKIDWIEDSRTVIITLDDNTIEIVIDTPFSNEMGIPVLSNEGRVFVPIRYIAETFGAIIEWNEENKTIFIKGYF